MCKLTWLYTGSKGLSLLVPAGQRLMINPNPSFYFDSIGPVLMSMYVTAAESSSTKTVLNNPTLFFHTCTYI